MNTHARFNTGHWQKAEWECESCPRDTYRLCHAIYLLLFCAVHCSGEPELANSSLGNALGMHTGMCRNSLVSELKSGSYVISGTCQLLTATMPQSFSFTNF